MVNLFLVMLVCLILGLIVVGGAILLISVSKRGQGVSDARRDWIEGNTDYQDDL